MTTPGSRCVLITGCSSGIGRATALHLQARGLRVYATARRRDALADLAAAGCRTLTLDVTDEDSMRAAVEAVEAAEGAVDVLVNNAGYSQSGALETLPMDLVRAQFETNVFGLIRLCQLVLPGMRRRRWGRIVNVSSMGGRLSFPGAAVYHASKHAVEALSDVLRFEAAPFGVDVVVIEPGLISSSFAEAAVEAIGEAGEAGPYADFNHQVAAATAGVYDTRMYQLLGGRPEAVARTIGKAVTQRRRPRTRYTVTPSAKVLITQHAVLPDRAWDAFLRTLFTPPRPGADSA
jgi:NAD(P)-dependent dehydrogenase (short-subunit alcohol dehydrogenase family)